MQRSTTFIVGMCLCFSACGYVLAQTAKAPTATIQDIGINSDPHGLTIVIVLSAPFIPQGVQVTNPDRLVFDFPGFTLPAGKRQIPATNGPVRKVRASLFQSDPPITRIVIDLKEAVNFEVKSAGNKVSIEVPFLKVGSVPAASTLPPASGEEKREKKKGESSPGSRADKLSKPVTAAPNQASSASAYKLQDKAKALKVEDLQNLEDKATAGDPEAETLLALALHSGTLLRRDDAEALHFLRKAANQGSMAAQESLGIFFAMGIGMEKPVPAEALEWYKKAAQQGSLDAATNIALMYGDGLGIPKNPAQAMIWFRRAAEGGDATAQYNLALIYGRGKDVPQDYKESLHWLTAAASRNLVPAIVDLAAFYLHPPDGTPADVSQAIHLSEEAAQLGSVPAEAMLGNIFASGAQGKPDYEKAVTWYRKAADQGQPAAQFNLATIYEEGKGTPADKPLAEHFYQLCADQGMAQAQFRLGRLLANNKESRVDQVSAYKWLKLAENSIKESSPMLADLRTSMTQEEIEEAEREANWRITHPDHHR